MQPTMLLKHVLYLVYHQVGSGTSLFKDVHFISTAIESDPLLTVNCQGLDDSDESACPALELHIPHDFT